MSPNGILKMSKTRFICAGKSWHRRPPGGGGGDPSAQRRSHICSKETRGTEMGIRCVWGIAKADPARQCAGLINPYEVAAWACGDGFPCHHHVSLTERKKPWDQPSGLFLCKHQTVQSPDAYAAMRSVMRHYVVKMASADYLAPLVEPSLRTLSITENMYAVGVGVDVLLSHFAICILVTAN